MLVKRHATLSYYVSKGKPLKMEHVPLAKLSLFFFSSHSRNPVKL